MKFIKSILSSFIALLLFFVFVFIIVAIIVGSSSSKPKVEDNTILKLSLDKIMMERTENNPVSKVFGDETIGLLGVLRAIEHAKDDEKIKGIYFEPPLMGTGMGKLDEIRNALDDFKSSGKFVITYSEIYTEAGYYLSSVADEIVINPAGEMEFNGYAANVTFFKGAMEKLDIEAQVFRTGNFKSFAEPYLRKDMSPENKEQLSLILKTISENYLNTIQKSRGIPMDKLALMRDSMTIRSPQLALSNKLVTKVGYFDEVLDILKSKVDVEEDKDLKFIGIEQYNETYELEENENKIAVIVAQGDIVNGKGDEKSIGSLNFARQIRKARNDDDVKAIVLRVNSRGGSALASDVIWREVMLAKKEKPIIASMSDVAASGGYYISMGCDTIVAGPNTITGSIGVVGIIPNFQGFLENKLGITNDGVKIGHYADLMTVTRPLTDGEKSIIQNSVDETYDEFTKKAGEGRSMPQDKIKEYGGGRVWTGTDAKKIGLVDVLGGINDAVKIAATKANLADEYSLEYYPKQKNLMEQLFEGLDDQQQVALKKELGEHYKHYESLKYIKETSGIQTRMMYDITIE